MIKFPSLYTDKLSQITNPPENVKPYTSYVSSRHFRADLHVHSQDCLGIIRRYIYFYYIVAVLLHLLILIIFR